MSRPAAVELLAAFARAMRERGIRWYVHGGQAVLVYGRLRTTFDVDITVELANQDRAALLAALEPHGFESRFPMSDELLAQLRLLPMVHVTTGIPIDLVVAAPGLEEELLARAKSVDVGGVEVPMISAEDLVALKILAGRRKDLEDVRGVLAEQQGRIDLGRTRELLGALEEALGKRQLLAKLDRLVRDSTTERQPAKTPKIARNRGTTAKRPAKKPR